MRISFFENRREHQTCGLFVVFPDFVVCRILFCFCSRFLIVKDLSGVHIGCLLLFCDFLTRLRKAHVLSFRCSNYRACGSRAV